MDGIANHFPATSALDCTILHIQSQHFLGGYPRIPAEASPVLGPRHQFPLGSPALPLFYETTTWVGLSGPLLGIRQWNAAGGRAAGARANWRSLSSNLDQPTNTRLLSTRRPPRWRGITEALRSCIIAFDRQFLRIFPSAQSLPVLPPIAQSCIRSGKLMLLVHTISNVFTRP